MVYISCVGVAVVAVVDVFEKYIICRIVKYQTWLSACKEMSTDVGTQTRLDAAHGVKNKAKVEKGLLIVADVARQNHKDKLQYEVTILNDEQPLHRSRQRADIFR